jgi:hypothetical protein
VSLISTTTAVVVRDICVSGATLAPFASSVANGRDRRHTHLAVVVTIVSSTNNLTVTVRDGASGESVGIHFLSSFLVFLSWY